MSWQNALTGLLHRADAELLRVVVEGREYDVPIPVGREIERLRSALLEIATYPKIRQATRIRLIMELAQNTLRGSER